MAAPLNPSFETAGPGAGEAQDWTLSIAFAGWMIGDFGGGLGDPMPIESFEQEPLITVITLGYKGLYDQSYLPDPALLESFNFWAGNWNYKRKITAGLLAEYAGGAQIETFDAPAATYVTTVSGGVSFFASFGETYAGAYVTTVSGGVLATFYRGTSTIESFQFIQPDVLFAVPVVANSQLITPTPHGLGNGEVVTVRSTGTPPGGLTTNVAYYVVNAATARLQLSLLPGGSHVTTLSAGIGTHRLHADETLFWTDGP